MKLEVRHLGRTYQIDISHIHYGQVTELRVQLEGPGNFSGLFQARLLGRTPTGWILELDGRIHEISLFGKGQEIIVSWPGGTSLLQAQGLRDRLRRQAQRTCRSEDTNLKARMPGKVIQVLHKPGDQVKAGEGLVIIEAMKMQNEITSPETAMVRTCHVREGTSVMTGDLLFELDVTDFD